MTDSTSTEAAELYIEARIIMSSDARMLPAVRHTIGNLTLELGYNESEARAITLAVEEALTNKIRHAYPGRPEGRIGFEFRTAPGALVFRLTDRGEAPDPSRICAREPTSTMAGGFGTHIIRDVMDEVVYRTAEEGNELLMTRYLPGRPLNPEAGQ